MIGRQEREEIKNSDQLMQGEDKKENCASFFWIFQISIWNPKKSACRFSGGLLPHSAYVSLKQAFILPDSFFT